MASQKPIESIQPNPELSYIIFTYLKNYYSNDPQLPLAFTNYVNKFRDQLTTRLGETEIKKLNMQVKKFKPSDLQQY